MEKVIPVYIYTVETFAQFLDNKPILWTEKIVKSIPPDSLTPTDIELIKSQAIYNIVSYSNGWKVTDVHSFRMTDSATVTINPDNGEIK